MRHSKPVASAIRELAALVRERQPTVVLSGAGISTESGIPDFRSATGVWAQYDPMEYATIRAFRRDPVKVWEFYALRFSVLTHAEPNAGHRALAELERGGLVKAIVTQNIDGLHQRAGSHDVLERCTARSARRAVSSAVSVCLSRTSSLRSVTDPLRPVRAAGPS